MRNLLWNDQEKAGQFHLGTQDVEDQFYQVKKSRQSYHNNSILYSFFQKLRRIIYGLYIKLLQTFIKIICSCVYFVGSR